MKQLLTKLNNERFNALIVMTPLKLYEERRPFSAEPDIEIHAYEKTREKEYFFRSEIDLSKDYKYLISADMLDYGYSNEENLSNSLNNEGSGRLTVRLDDNNLRKNILYLEGTINASSYDFSSIDDKKIAVLQLFGVKKNIKLQLFEELLLEAYSLELEKNYRVSFFSYFTAIEAYVTFWLEPVKLGLYSELHRALEYLQLDDKLRLIFKYSSGVSDLNEIKLWSDFMGLFKDLKDKRNEIAHGKSVVDINILDIQHIFLVVCVLWSFTTNKHKTFNEIRRFIY